ncbi:SUMF1/EgtB/PvdO family nonheme iron enzyme [Nostocaceae cyanobacterium CENA369]|uniref:SUMF1/EgtB/PvdO family nonheme iron enzyme n=1 Tax=Dendronalium phyllosphericum CENA369 TaxID=1725256 RepID=A0A8J7IFY2_9NOST|nr:bifunctional serine/threonine-protein kinase/formylglycine-generating enzyme family protein [Dendronalium phyllosphericum]MBH8576627.1 SUMF1/EgtB/PvdO family nonheme iron enzyme [Dendronalium phyllosphericum CENA369]
MPTTGTVLRNRYKIIKILGSGGFGDTYLAEDLDLPNHPKCVVKHLKPNSNPTVLQIVRRLFDSEAQVLYRLSNDSDQIPRLFAHFEEQSEFYLVQEFIDGKDLGHEISSGKRLTEKEVTKLLQEILEVLAVVHKKNIIHRDIKTQNIMRRRQDSKIVLIDFGAVKEVNTLMVNAQGQTSVSVTIGTAGYMPSEQAAGQPKLCSDVYAVGMLGIYALTGLQPHELPKDPTNGEIIWRNWANVSEKLAQVLSKMVSYHFRDRYPSAVEALQALTPPQKQAPRPAPTPTSTPNFPRRRVIQTVALIAAGFGLAIVGERFLFRPDTRGGTIDDTTTTIPPETETQSSPSKSSTSSQQLQTFQFETVTVNAQGSITNRRNHQANYLVEDLGNSVTLEMVQIPGGTFTMGSPAVEEKRNSDEGPQHQVKVPGFFMGKYEVTQAQYQAIMGNNPSGFKGEKRPVENVSWNDAVEFCKRLSQKTGRTYRLPSEAEWEYACRARTTTPFYFGETITTDLANYRGTDYPVVGTSYLGNYGKGPKGQYRGETTPVGNFPPNAFGLYDMHGNVHEWCQDYWHENYNSAPIDGNAWLNDSDIQARRVLRGGYWQDIPVFCRSADRFTHEADVNNLGIGFRVVLVSA